MEGEGVGWLKLNRIRKLMEDENYRNLVVSRLNKTLDQKIGPDEHIDDVVRSTRSPLSLKIPHRFLAIFAVRIAPCLERNAEIASGYCCRIRTDVREPRVWRHGFRVSVIGNSSYSLLDERLGGRW